MLTPADELRILAETLGRPLELVEPSVEAVKAGMLKAGTAEPVVDAIVARTLSDKGAEAEVVPTVGELLGRPPATFASWAKTHAEQFSGGSDHH